MCGQYDLLYCSIHNLVYTVMLQRGEKKYVDYLRWKQIDWKVQNKDWIQYVYSEEKLEKLSSESEEEGVTAAVSFNREVAQEEHEWRAWDSELMVILKDCADFHSFIIRTVEESEKCLRYILAAALIHFILLLCLLIYALSAHLVLDNTLNHILIYSGLTYALACLMCYPAHILIYQVRKREVLEFYLLLKYGHLLLTLTEYSIDRCRPSMSLVYVWAESEKGTGYSDGECEKASIFDLWKGFSGGLGYVCNGKSRNISCHSNNERFLKR